MSGNLSDIKRRLTSVRQMRKIVGAMETVSISKMRKAAEKYDKSKAYIELLKDTLTDIVSNAETEEYSAPAAGRSILIVVSSDKGMCGGFDHDIFKAADAVADENTTVMPIGEIGAKYYAEYPRKDMRFAQMYNADGKTAKAVADDISGIYGNGVGSVSIAYSELTSRSSYGAKVERLLPINISRDIRRPAVSLEPSVGEVIEKSMPLYVAGMIYGALAANIAAEHCARHAAMSTAAESADQVIASLMTEYNRTRQTSVTEQIIEIIGATSALNTKGVGHEERS